MKKMKILVGVFAMCFLTSCGWTAEVPTNTAEVLYQVEEYVSPYTYVFEYDMYHEYPIKLKVWGFNLLVGHGKYRVVLQPDGKIETIVNPETDGVQKTEVENLLKSFLLEEELTKLLDKECYLRRYEDCVYIFAREHTEKNYACDLFVCKEGVIKTASFTVSSNLMEVPKEFLWEVFSDDSVCIGEEVWFDENLQSMERAKYDEWINQLKVEQMQKSLNATGVEELIALAEDKRFAPFQHRCEDVVVCYQNSVEKKYVLVFDKNGELLSAICVTDLDCGYSWTFKVQKYDPETDTYYYIKH